jgi:uncharacterized membrane protein
MITTMQKPSTLFHPLLIVVAGLIFTIPAILYGFPHGHDAVVQLNRYKHFADQLWSGELYPRWLLDMNAGLGSPTFFFYGPVPFFVSSIFHPFVPDDLHGWHQLGLACSLALVISGLGAYLWLREVSNSKSALFAAIIYMILPYHLAVDFYRRAAIGEYWTFVWMPLVLYFTRRIAAGSRRDVVGLTVTYALLIMTHAPITLIFSLIPPSYVLFIAEKNQISKALIRTVASMLLGIGLSAIYLAPAIATRDTCSIAKPQKAITKLIFCLQGHPCPC